MTRTTAQRPRRIADRLSPLIATVGVTAIPNLLIRHQARLRLTGNELVYLLHVLAHRWDNSGWPWLALNEVATATGSAPRSVRDWRAALLAKGYLTLRPRGRSGGGRAADEHDLSGLFGALEALAIEEAVQHATLQARQNLPAPTFYRGVEDVPQLPAAVEQRRPGLRTQRVRAHTVRESNAAETGLIARGAIGPVSAALIGPEPACFASRPLKETVNKKPLTPLPPRGRGDAGSTRRRRRPSAKRDGVATATAPEMVAWDLVVAFHARLKCDASALTAGNQRQELRAAQRLLARGASPSEARRFIDDVLDTPGRWAAPTLRLFDKEREGWLARCGGTGGANPNDSSLYQHDPWQGRRPPIAEEDLARAAL